MFVAGRKRKRKRGKYISEDSQVPRNSVSSTGIDMDSHYRSF
jgi:hypothetical protein